MELVNSLFGGRNTFLQEGGASKLGMHLYVVKHEDPRPDHTKASKILQECDNNTEQTSNKPIIPKKPGR